MMKTNEKKLDFCSVAGCKKPAFSLQTDGKKVFYRCWEHNAEYVKKNRVYE